MEKSTIKSKLLEFCELRGITKSTLAQNLDISPSNFMKSSMNSSLNSETIVRFLQMYPEISAEWLMRDEGEMLRPDSKNQQKTENTESAPQNSDELTKDDVWKELVDTKNQYIELQAERIRELQQRVAELNATQK